MQCVALSLTYMFWTAPALEIMCTQLHCRFKSTGSELCSCPALSVLPAKSLQEREKPHATPHGTAYAA